MSFLEAVVLGAMQGLTEFLPVSSSGHLAVLQELWRTPDSARLGLTAVLHLGTAASLVVFFRRQLGDLLAGLVAADPDRRRASLLLAGRIALASVPAAIVGLTLDDLLGRVFAAAWLVGPFLLVTAVVLFATRFVPERERRLGWVEALVVGLAQAVAILPGVSRSGATVATATFLGLGRKDAFEFSFLLSVPVVLAAAVKELVGLDWSAVRPAPVALGVVVAFGAGLAALWLLRWMMARRRLHWFAPYCLVAGLAILLFLR